MERRYATAAAPLAAGESKMSYNSTRCLKIMRKDLSLTLLTHFSETVSMIISFARFKTTRERKATLKVEEGRSVFHAKNDRC